MIYGLKILLAHGHFLLLVMPLDEARAFVKNWNDGKYADDVVLGGRSRNHPAADTDWACRLCDVVGMHTFAEQAPQQQMPVQPPALKPMPGHPWTGMS